ncbi:MULTISPECIES: response regulator transcription factor [Rheinheimera]|jgi:DNA-binding NarL/FixJ family response regulator|uniref:Response regulator transcription factor n=1 Tax=Rheinheimera aquimaris TaxID=412437 RepID=A0ABN1DE46_9GAMM|nr:MULTISPECIES: response regulator transcription factor [Rheinheimera]MCB5212223.1 response regulator transcription factor [Rheinheimera aquimaris]MCD1599334.1 response regulator transcription factor [Rheinheimera aquimaris]HBN89496.1 DNA-binding response regulator [Rheinheimera sp.]|tara:strand:- start:1725 stop:2402 length:678 start_codon:yes stop_codon:yes gene_type:complete
MAKLIVADDHPLFRNALINAISSTFATKATIETDSFDSTCTALEEHPDTDLLLLDLHMPGNCGFLGLIQLRKSFPTLPIVVISASEELDVIRRVMAFGASAYVPKSANPADISAALNSVMEGELWVPAALKKLVLEQHSSESEEDLDLAAKVAQLTHQQYKVLYYLTEGWLNKQIAYDLHISEATVKAHITAIFRKLGVTNRTQVVIQAQRLTLEPPVNKAMAQH